MNKIHAENLVNIGCICCDLLGLKPLSRTEIHHVRTGQGMSQKAGDYLTVPLCIECHRGTSGIHGKQFNLKLLKMTELDLLDETYKRLLS